MSGTIYKVELFISIVVYQWRTIFLSLFLIGDEHNHRVNCYGISLTFKFVQKVDSIIFIQQELTSLQMMSCERKKKKKLSYNLVGMKINNSSYPLERVLHIYCFTGVN